MTSAMDAAKPETTTAAGYWSVFDDLADVFLRTSRDGRILIASRSIEALLGWPRDEVIGKDAAMLYGGPADRDAFISTLTRFGGQASRIEIPLRHRDGRVV